ncbi:sodium:proton antiporter NhaD [Blattabacterium cuenoti]|uniref:sodium:proton antiporter NhaD n=1 Tax=Blattabacterium cuenoti TaxID=1653831 RepID=UPI00163CA31D|nr:sodium:proton antiporter NhaD [Blattabacterium cuenoti]
MLILVFIIGYLFITLENILFLNKVVPSLIMASVCWSLIMFCNLPVFELNHKNLIPWNNSKNHLLLLHLGKASEIIFFLIGAMSIISIIDVFSGFESLKELFSNNTKRKFLWIMTFLSFVLSAIIDNLTATIVMVSLLRKIISDYKDRLYYLGFVIISANAGGVWSPIGDITTTMLWISNKVTTVRLIKEIFIPSFLCMFSSTIIGSQMSIFNGFVQVKKSDLSKSDLKKGFLMLNIGLLLMLLVPLFKTITGVPPYMGMMFSLGIFCIVITILNKGFSIDEVFRKIDISSVLFFLGILLSVSALESLGVLYNLSQWIKKIVFTWKLTTFIFGFISSIIDNVPLVAATIAMFSYPIDHEFWHFIAYVSGAGGSLFIIGSASGVAAMGMEKIDFLWYLKKISWLALIGYLSGFFFLLVKNFFL